MDIPSNFKDDFSGAPNPLDSFFISFVAVSVGDSLLVGRNQSNHRCNVVKVSVVDHVVAKQVRSRIMIIMEQLHATESLPTESISLAL